VLETIAAIGYEGVEFAGLFGNGPKQIRGVLDRLGMAAVGAHLDLMDLEDRRDETIREIRELECGAAIIAWLPPALYADERSARETVGRPVAAGDVVHSAGLRFAYHNYDFEFRPIRGASLWSLLTASDSDELSFEIDVLGSPRRFRPGEADPRPRVESQLDPREGHRT
jgi:sugar phosphate isomerase/epimerase